MNSLSLVLLTEYYQSPFVQQVVPLFVMELFSLPGAPGLFLAACTAASLRWGIEFIVFNSFSTLTTKKTLLDFWHFAMGLYWRPADYSSKGSVIQKAFPCHDTILVWFKKIIDVLMTPDILSIPIICYHYEEFIQQTFTIIMMTSPSGNIFRLLAICAGNSLVTGDFPTQRLVTRSFDANFDLHLNGRLSKQSWGWWFETPSC